MRSIKWVVNESNGANNVYPDDITVVVVVVVDVVVVDVVVVIVVDVVVEVVVGGAKVVVVVVATVLGLLPEPPHPAETKRSKTINNILIFM